jgi:hypothetical protein
MISGGGRVLLFHIKTNRFNSWSKWFDYLDKKNQKGNYFEALKFKEREKLFGLRFLRRNIEPSFY